MGTICAVRLLFAERSGPTVRVYTEVTMRLLSTLILVFSITAGCRADDGPSADTRVLDDMERLAIELVRIMENSWCEPGIPEGSCMLATGDAHTITHVILAQIDRGAYGIVLDGVLIEDAELDGQGTVAYDWGTPEVSFSGLVAVDDSAMYDVDMRVDIVDWNHYAVEGVVDDASFAFDLHRRTTQSIDDDDMGCRGVELGITCE